MKLGDLVTYRTCDNNGVVTRTWEVTKQLMFKLLKNNLDNTFNSITVDSDTSTSDTLMMFSVGNKKINLHKNNFKI